MPDSERTPEEVAAYFKAGDEGFFPDPCPACGAEWRHLKWGARLSHTDTCDFMTWLAEQAVDQEG